MSRSILGIYAAFAILSATGGCREGSLPATPALISIRVSPETPTLRVGENVQLSVAANVSTSEGFLWRSSDEKVASVSGSGLVTAIGSGQAMITVKLVADTMAVGSTGVIVK